MGKVICKLGLLGFFQRAVSNNYIFYFLVFVPIVLITYRQIRNSASNEDDDEGEEVDKKEK